MQSFLHGLQTEAVEQTNRLRHNLEAMTNNARRSPLQKTVLGTKLQRKRLAIGVLMHAVRVAMCMWNYGLENVDVPPPSVQFGVYCFHIGMPNARPSIIRFCKSVRVLVHWSLPRLPKFLFHKVLPVPQTVIVQLPPTFERSILPPRHGIAKLAFRVFPRDRHHLDSSRPGVMSDIVWPSVRTNVPSDSQCPTMFEPE